MAVVTYEGAGTEFQGTSFERTIVKKDGTDWDATHVGTLVLIDDDGVELISRTMVIDDGGFQLTLTQTETLTLSGNYILAAFLTDAVDLDKKEALVIYILNYSKLKP